MNRDCGPIWGTVFLMVSSRYQTGLSSSSLRTGVFGADEGPYLVDNKQVIYAGSGA